MPDSDVVATVVANDPTLPSPEQLTALAHPGLVLVIGVIVGGGERRVVTARETGVTLARWIETHPDATLTERAHLLRQVAAALDAMRAAGVAHGGLRAANVIVRPNASTVLVGLGIHVGSSEQDALDFAVLAAQTMTSDVDVQPDEDGSVNAAELARALRTSPLTRRHAQFNRRLLAAIGAEPEARPRQLRRWLDEALEPQRQTDTDVASIPAPEVGASQRRVRRGRLLAAVAAALAITGAIAVFVLTRSGDPKAAAKTAPFAPLVVTRTSWPIADACDPNGAVAAPAGARSYTEYRDGADPRQRIAKDGGGGAWLVGHLRFTVLSHSSKEIWIQAFRRTGESRDATTAVAWVYRTARPNCRPAPHPADLLLSLDFGGLKAVGATSDAPSPLPIRVDPGDALTIDIAVTTCDRNWQWGLSLTYAEAGHRSTTIVVGGPFRTFGVADQNTLDIRGQMIDQRLKITTSRAAIAACVGHDSTP